MEHSAVQRQDAMYYAISHACNVDVVDKEPGTVCCVVIHERQKLDVECIASESSASTGQECSQILLTQNQGPESARNRFRCKYLYQHTYVACNIEGGTGTGLSLAAERIHCVVLRLLLAAS